MLTLNLSAVQAFHLSRRQGVVFSGALVALLHASLFANLLSQWLAEAVCFGLSSVWTIWAGMSRVNFVVRILVTAAAYGSLGLAVAGTKNATMTHANRFIDGLYEWGSFGLPSILLLLVATKVGFCLCGPASYPVVMPHLERQRSLQFSLISMCALILVVAALLGVGKTIQHHLEVSLGLSGLSYVAPAVGVAFTIQTLIILWLAFGLTPLVPRCIGTVATLICTFVWMEWIFGWPGTFEWTFIVAATLSIAILTPIRLVGFTARRVAISHSPLQ